MQSVETQNAED